MGTVTLSHLMRFSLNSRSRPVLYVVFDLETTGIPKKRDKIVELAAVILQKNGIQMEDASFVQFFRPTNPISPFVTVLTSITNNDVCNAESFIEVGGAFIQFMLQYADNYNSCFINHIVLVLTERCFLFCFLSNSFVSIKLMECF